MWLARSTSRYCGSCHNPPGCLSCFLVWRAGNHSLREQASLGRDGFHLPRHLPPPGSQSLFCLWGLYTDVGESQFLDASKTLRFSPECSDGWELSISSISENDDWSQEYWWGRREHVGATARSPRPSNVNKRQASIGFLMVAKSLRDPKIPCSVTQLRKWSIEFWRAGLSSGCFCMPLPFWKVATLAAWQVALLWSWTARCTPPDRVLTSLW